MEHLGKKIFLAVAQQPFEHVGESGITNSFATLVPLLTTDGDALDPADFKHYGLVFWMVRSQALRFADPGRLIAGRLERAVKPDRLEYQLAPDSVEVVQPSELIEILTVEHPLVSEPRDLVNVDSVLTLDHPPTPLVLVRWGNEIYGPFRTEARAQQAGRAPWQVGLRTNRTDQTVFRIPAGDFKHEAKFGSQVRADMTATITYEDRDPTTNVPIHVCHYSALLGSGFRRLPAMGYPLISVETDGELLLRYARRFTNRKNVQLLRNLLPEVPELDSRTDPPTGAEKQVLESVRRRAGQIEGELSALARALVSSGLIDKQIEEEVTQKAQEHISQQVATLSTEIAGRLSEVRAELETLVRQRDVLADELESKRRLADREIEKGLAELERKRLEEDARIETAKRDLDQQRATLSKHLERVIEKYESSRDDVINQFILLAPFLHRAGLPSADSPEQAQAQQETYRHSATLEFPSFVTGAADHPGLPALTELEFFERFERHVRDSGYNYRKQDLASFHIGVKCCDITILGGISGTGKSTLPLLYAEALSGESAPPSPGRYLHVGVSPAWLDARDLLGHVNSLDRRFEPSESGLFRQLIFAQEEFKRRHQESGIYVVMLDEMNLSHVEHYFSGFLQALEHSREIRSFDSSSVSPDSTFASYALLKIPKSIRFVGTVNFDETTKPLSLRVLDRANLVRLRPLEQTAIFPAVSDQRPSVVGPAIRLHHFREWRRANPLDRDVAAVWDRIQQNLATLGAPVTPRRRQAIQEFMASTPSELMTPFQAFDMQICQRLLPQVRGLYRPGTQEALDDLERTLTQHPHRFHESVTAIAELRRIEQSGLPLGEPTGY